MTPGSTWSQSAPGAFVTVTKSLRKNRLTTPGTSSKAFATGVTAFSFDEMIFEPLQNGDGTVTLYAFGFGVGSKRRCAIAWGDRKVEKAVWPTLRDGTSALLAPPKGHAAMPRRPAVAPRRLSLRTSGWARWACFGLTLLPVPGLGAAILGWRNPHTRLLRNGLLQMALVAFGSWPLVVPGAAGLAWAAWDAVRIAQADLLPLPPKGGVDPASA